MYVPSYTAVPIIAVIIFLAQPTPSRIHRALQTVGLAAYDSHVDYGFFVVAFVAGCLLDEIRKRGLFEVMEKVREYVSKDLTAKDTGALSKEAAALRDVTPNGVGASNRA